MFAHKVQSIAAAIGSGSPMLTRTKKEPKRVIDQIATFDIETCVDPDLDESYMYIWQWAIETADHGTALYMLGRTWDQFRAELQEVNRALDDLDASLVCYVHNLSYEFAFLCGVTDCEEIFATGAHKILLFHVGRIHFRCSYQLTGYGLAQLTKIWHCEHGKLSGDDFDYDEIRYPWTELTPEQEAYCINDVVGLIEALRALLNYHGDTLLTVPFTKTGYVRRDIKQAFKVEDQIYKQLKAGADVSLFKERKKTLFTYWKRCDLQPLTELYKILNDAMRGGNTHGNRFYAGKIVRYAAGKDRCSSYPDVLINCMYPIKPFKKAGFCSYSDLDAMHKRGVPFVVRIAMHNVRLKDKLNPCPYIPYDKVFNCAAPWLDNGRILSTAYLEMAITDIDWHIIRDQYLADDIIVTECWTSKYGRLPECVRKVIFDYYKIKTEYKGVEGREDEYRNAKENANSCYGMMATNPVRPELVFNKETGDFDYDIENYDIDHELLINKKKGFLPYQWGVWTTAWARYYLQLAIDAAGNDFIYTDTDSIKHVQNPEVDDKLARVNRKILATSIKNGAFAQDVTGKTHYLGVYENEGNYSKFATLGAKKYIYQDDKGLHIVIAGVNKKVGAQELEKIAKDQNVDPFRLFCDKNITFNDAGGTEAKYYYHEPYMVERDGHQLEITANVRIKKHQYVMGISDEYDALLSDDFVKFMARKLIEQDTFDKMLEDI